VAISVTLGVFAALHLVARFGFKIYSKIPIDADDWFILATAAVAFPSEIVLTHGLTANGLGQDIWTIQPDKITVFFTYYLAYIMTYCATMPLLKMSLLFFYLRIFPSSRIRKVLWATVVIDALYGLIFVIVAVLQCQPVSFFWTAWDGQHVGTCVDLKAVAWMNAGIGIAIDVWMLAVPLWEIRNLQLHWRKKIAVSLMFAVGTL
jgi:hypothetical protein